MQPRSHLAYALLGLLQQQPSSGYSVRKFFDSTPLGTYSSSPGAIYPALQRLERQGLIRGKVDRSTTLRPKQIYHVTRKGKATLEEWLRAPVTQDDLERGVDAALLKFSLMGLLGEPQVSVQFLRSFREFALEAARKVENYVDGTEARMPIHGRLALENGIAQYRSLARWAAKAIGELEGSRKKRTP